jgi:hypothetical protein
MLPMLMNSETRIACAPRGKEAVYKKKTGTRKLSARKSPSAQKDGRKSAKG